MGDEDRVPTSPIKPRPRPRGAVLLQRVRRTRRREGSVAGEVRRAGWRPPFPTSPAPLGPRPPALPRPLPHARRGSYRNSAGSRCRDAPPRGPRGARPRGRAPEAREEGEREKFEKQASRGEPDKPGSGRAGAASRAGPRQGPRELGGGPTGGRGHSASTARDSDGGREPRGPCAPALPGC